MKKSLPVIASIFVSGLLVFGAYLLASSDGDVLSRALGAFESTTPTNAPLPTREPSPEPDDSQAYVYPSPMPTGPVDIDESGHPAIGREDAPIYMVEYVDYECPKCAEFHNKYFDLLKRDYIDTGKMRFVMKDFPLSGHRRARMSAEIADCVYRLNGERTFWDFVDTVFEKQEEWVAADNVLWALSVYAKDLGVDTDKLQACFKEKPDSSRIDGDIQEAKGFGLIGTPTFFVNGRPIIGVAPSYDDLVGAIETLSTEK